MKTHLSRNLLIATSLLLFAHAQFAELRTWTDKEGNSKEAELVNVFGPMTYFKDVDGGFTPFLASDLSEEDQVEVEAFRQAKTTHPWEDSKSEMAKRFKGRLFALKDGKSVNFKFGPDPEPDFYLLYFVSPGDEEGDEFTPKLVKVYSGLKASSLNNFEIIQITQTRSTDQQKEYMEEMGVPWPAIKWTSRKWLRDISAIKGEGSLHLVLLDQEGNVLQRTLADREDLQPANVILALNNLLAWSNPENPLVVKHRFRQMLAGRLAENPADAGPRPYMCNLKGIDFSKIPGGVFKVKMRVTTSGGVDNIEFASEIPEEEKESVLKEISNWLFIPRVKDGAYIDTTVAFPVQKGS